MRLILADHDITMRPGEVAEFDTSLPHWFGPAGDQPVEILSLLGRHSNRARSAGVGSACTSGSVSGRVAPIWSSGVVRSDTRALLLLKYGADECAALVSERVHHHLSFPSRTHEAM